jgi:hypothetical protein
VKIRELIDFLSTMEPQREAFIALAKMDGTGDAFEIEEVGNNDGDAQLGSYEEEEEDADEENTE